LEQDYRVSSTVLGSGYSGSVRLATAKHTNSKQPCAVKTFRLKGLHGSKKERLLSEIEVYLRMDHPHVARLLDVYETDIQINIVMECMEGGELFDRVIKMKCFNEQDAAEATRQMLLALHYVHSHGMVHRDLKLENFLYDHQSCNHLKMIDFGFSKHVDDTGRMKTSCGTLAYVAPEVLKRSYTKACDLWSMGVIVFVLLSGHMPFHGDSDDQMKAIKRARYEFKPEHWAKISTTAKGFVQSLLELDPAKRLTSEMALEHTWILENYKALQSVDISIINGLCSWGTAPKLQRAYMMMMAWGLSNRQQAMVRDYFVALDTDHDGTISKEELQAAMEGKFPEPKEEADKVFKALDGAEIQYSDFLAAMISSCIPIDDDLLHTAFAKFDVGSSGYIESGELRGILGLIFDGADVEALVNDADCSHKGQIDYQEFANYAKTYHPGTLFRKSGTPASIGQPDNSNKAKEPPQEKGDVVRVVEIAPVAQSSKQACCIVQ
jgi:calcium-dependent protein kinase